MFCSYCNEKIMGKPIMQGGEPHCSLECANLASGIDSESEEAEEYFEEEPIQDLYQFDEE